MRTDVILTSYFRPPVRGVFSSEFVAHELTSTDLGSIDLVLQQFVDDGLIEAVKPSAGRCNYYRPTNSALVARENLLRRLGRRHPCLVNQRSYSPQDLVLALAINEDEAWRVNPPRGAYLRGGASSQMPIDRCHFYLDLFSVEEVDDAIKSLVSGGFVRIAPAHSGVEDGQAVEITITGHTLYNATVRNALGISEDSFLLKESKLDAIKVFFSWQSDFPESSEQIRLALKTWAAEANASLPLVAPIKIVEATANSDGAVRIDVQIIEGIKGAHFFAADITPVYKYRGRACPNPNVLIELGYALAGKDASEILLLLKKRESKDIPGDEAEARLPFDVASVKHESFESFEIASEKIARNLTAVLNKRGFTWNGESGGEPVDSVGPTK